MLLIGDYNVVATDGIADIYSPTSWKNDALLDPLCQADELATTVPIKLALH